MPMEQLTVPSWGSKQKRGSLGKKKGIKGESCQFRSEEKWKTRGNSGRRAEIGWGPRFVTCLSVIYLRHHGRQFDFNGAVHASSLFRFL